MNHINGDNILKGILPLLCLIFLSCSNTNSKPYETSKYCNALDFLLSRNYTYSTSKATIPSIVIDSLSQINKEVFKIGDIYDTSKINLSDATLGGYEYKRKLNFVLVNDSVCLLAYTEGGLGTHDVVDFINYKGKLTHTRYITTSLLNDTNKLNNFLRNLGLVRC